MGCGYGTGTVNVSKVLLPGVGMENRPESAAFARMVRTCYRNAIDATLGTRFPLAS